MNDAQKLQKIRNICDHPVAYHRTGQEMANTIRKVLNDDRPIDYELTDADEPIRYELAHDAVFISDEEM